MCCTKQGEKVCHNFSQDINNPTAIVYGFNDYGYVNTIKCIKDTPEARANETEQSKTLDELLSGKYELWKKLSRDNKLVIYGSIINLFKIYGVKLTTIDGKIGETRKKFGIISNKINISEVSKTISVKESDIVNKLKVSSPDYKKALEQISKVENMEQLKKILSDYGFTNDQVVLNSNVILDVAKEISSIIIFAKFLFSNFSYSDSSNTIVKIMGIMSTKQTFGEIFSETNIIPRYYTLILQAILSSIQNGKFAVVGKYDMSSVPLNVINYIQSKPTDQSLSLCNVYSIALGKFRKDRVINAIEYVGLDEKMDLYCNPDKIKINNVDSNNIPLSESKGLNVLERTHDNYSKFYKEQADVAKKNMSSEIISDNILYNFIKNTYN
jgi:hypothetical protein